MIKNNHQYKILKNPQQTNFNVIELFAGCGGMALGFENAGLQTKLLVEIDKNCCETLAKNRPHWYKFSTNFPDRKFLLKLKQKDVIPKKPDL